MTAQNTKMLPTPRAGSVEIAGIAWLARMTDKARLEAAGQIEALDLEYPCPMDQRLLSQLGIAGPKFQQLAVQAQSDDELVSLLKANGAKL
ncbi:MAG: DUF5069 domain-containing protein [Vampirovibrionales bacterium]|nr:DUF5069 domain-containing protein [Vampirovibrionales bacterium]